MSKETKKQILRNTFSLVSMLVGLLLLPSNLAAQTPNWETKPRTADRWNLLNRCNSDPFQREALLFLRMEFLMTPGAEGNQVGLGIVSQSASWLNVVNLKVGRPAAVLAAPTIPLQHLLA